MNNQHLIISLGNTWKWTIVVKIRFIWGLDESNGTKKLVYVCEWWNKLSALIMSRSVRL